MDWLEEVKVRVKRKNSILFSQGNPLIQEVQQLVDRQNHRTAALWALALAGETAQRLGEAYPQETRPQRAVALSRAWAAGQVKMPVAQRAILDVHAFAKELDSPEDIAHCHAVGQACGVVHATGHAVGFPVYDLTALVLRHGVEYCRQAVEQRVADYFAAMQYWRGHWDDARYTWADFMCRD